LNKVIWTLWFQGRETAPTIVRKCIESWEACNPGWQVRCLDARDVEQYVPLREHVDLERQVITHASLSDIVRILLLHEYGGVWVDATLLCNRPLDEWLGEMTGEGFFAFANPAPDRPLSSWFLAATPGNGLITRWCARTLEYWQDRKRADEYFWFHHLFRSLCETEPAFAASWDRVPKVSAAASHILQALGFDRPASEVVDKIDWDAAVFKLTHRSSDIKPGSLLSHAFSRIGGSRQRDGKAESPSASAIPASGAFASLKVGTNNLGDHMQIIAGRLLLGRFGVAPELLIDRDDEMRSAPSLAGISGPVPILLGGWFKRNSAEWPPSEKLLPLFLGFHIRLFQAPELVSPDSIAYFRKFEPIGCRDPYTCELLRGYGVDAYVSGCLSLIFPRRPALDPAPEDVLVVSRDERLLQILPAARGPYTYVSHYTGSDDFEGNMARAEDLLRTYRARARLIVTSMLHCALPAIAMGIPVIAFYPPNDAAGHQSDVERFSLLERFVRVYKMSEISEVDWEPKTVDVSEVKLVLRDRLAAFVAGLGWSGGRAIGPIAPASELPPP
jgi:hypothetical protein